MKTVHPRRARTLGRRGVALAAAGAAAAMLLAACGGGSSSSTGGGGGSGSTGSVKGQTITYWASVEGTGPAQTTSTLTKEFRTFTKQTGVHVKLQVIPWSDLEQKILTSVTSGSGPDVMEIGNTWSPSLAASGGFVSFTPSTFAKIGGESKFVKTGLEVAGAPGKAPMSVPVYGEAYALVYNKADFKAAGISQPPKTWTQLLADGKKLTTHGRHGIAIEGNSASEAAHWAFFLGEQAGNPLYSGGKWDFATPKEATAVSTYINMVAKGGIASPADAEYDSSQSVSDFANNKTAMLVWQNPTETLAQLGMKPSQYGVTPIPVPNPLPAGGKAVESFPAGINLAVPSSTSHEAAALKLVKFMTSTATQVKINETYGTFPTITSAYKAAAFQTPDAKVFEKIYSGATPLPQVPSESTMETDLGGAINHLIGRAASTGAVSDSQILAALKSAQDQLNASQAAG